VNTEENPEEIKSWIQE